MLCFRPERRKGKGNSAGTSEVCAKSLPESNIWLGSKIHGLVFPLALDTDIGVVLNGQLISLAAGLAKFQCPPWFTPFRKHLAENCLGLPARQSFAF